MVFMGLIIISCTKVGAAEEENLDAIDLSDKTPPVLTVAKPTANQVFVSSDSIIAEGKVVDEKVMYRGKVQIKNDVTAAIVAENYFETHFLHTLNYRLAYKAIVTSPTDFSVIIEFQDHGANPVASVVKVKVNP